MIRIKALFILSLVAGLWSCSLRFRTSYVATNTPVLFDTLAAQSMTQLVLPYRKEIHEIMDKPIGYSKYSYSNFRGQSPVGKFITKLIHAKAQKEQLQLNLSDPTCPLFTLLNAGGIRAELTKGIITKGTVYTLLPFDNELVFARFKMEQLMDLRTLKSANPLLLIAGDTTWFRPLPTPSTCPYFWVASSNFLIQGGDKVTFFQQADSIVELHHNLRDVLMQQILSTDSLQLN